MYDSEYWNNTVAYNEGSGTSLHDTETKLSSFWSTPFTRLCLGMKYEKETNWIALNYVESSLREVIGNNDTFKETNMNVTEWKKLLNNSRIQVKIKNQILTLLDRRCLSFHRLLGPKREKTFFDVLMVCFFEGDVLVRLFKGGAYQKLVKKPF